MADPKKDFDALYSEIEKVAKARQEHLREAEQQTAEEEERDGRRAEGWVVFVISRKDLIPERISRELGMKPDRIYYSGLREGRIGYWQLNSQLSGNKEMDDHFWNLLSRLAPVRNNLLELSKNCTLEFNCTIQKTGRKMKPVILPSRMLLLIGHLNADIEFEMVDKYS